MSGVRHSDTGAECRQQSPATTTRWMGGSGHEGWGRLGSDDRPRLGGAVILYSNGEERKHRQREEFSLKYLRHPGKDIRDWKTRNLWAGHRTCSWLSEGRSAGKGRKKEGRLGPGS